MKKQHRRLLIVLIAFSALLACTAASANVPRMSKEDLKSRLGDGNTIIIDVRTGSSWEKSGSKIKGAIREDPGDIASWIKKYQKEKTIVLYCS